MNKKKIAGLIIFAIFIGLIFGYPAIKEEIQERLYKKNIERLMQSEHYKEAYAILSHQEISGYNWEYLALIRSELYLGYPVEDRIKKLIEFNRKEQIQVLVDEFQDMLGPYLLLELSTVEGIIFSEKVKDFISLNFYLRLSNPEYSDFLGKAMKIRGDREVIDPILIRHLLHNGEIEQVLQLYDEIPDEYLPHSNLAISEHLYLRSIFYWEDQRRRMYKESVIVNNFKNVSTLPLPDKILGLLGIEASYVDSVWDTELYNVINKIPFITENIHYQYHRLLASLTGDDSNLFNQALNELKAREEFHHIDGYQEAIQVAENFKRVDKFIKVSSDGVLLYQELSDTEKAGENKGYDFYSSTHLDNVVKDKIEFVSTSPNRAFYLTSVWDEKIGDYYYMVLDSRFNLVNNLGFKEDKTTAFTYWIDNENVFFYGDKVNVITNESQRYSHMGGGGIIGPTPNYIVYSRDEQTVTTLDYKTIQTSFSPSRQYTHYTIRDVESEKILYQFDFGENLNGHFSEFIGSCDQYIYRQRAIGRFYTIEAIEKETLNRYLLPFYTTEHNWSLSFFN